MSILLKAFSKIVMPAPNVLKCGTFVFIAPHPDDIEVGCGALVAKLSSLGKRIVFITVTDGACGAPNFDTDTEELIETRKKEAVESARLLGVNDVRFLGFPDGGGYDELSVAQKIALIISEVKPDIVFAPDPHTRSETHPDHIKTGKSAEIALLIAQNHIMIKNLGAKAVHRVKALAYYLSDKPNKIISVFGFMNKKIKALSVFKSQFRFDSQAEKTFKLLCLYFRLQAFAHGIKRLRPSAEAYKIMRIELLHCTPDV